jgi:hypothetical protein
MKTGVYRKVRASGRGRGTGVGNYYQFLLLSRDHFTGMQLVTYIPLRIEPEWAGTVRPCTIAREDFERMFEYIGEGLPE